MLIIAACSDTCPRVNGHLDWFCFFAVAVVLCCVSLWKGWMFYDAVRCGLSLEFCVTCIFFCRLLFCILEMMMLYDIVRVVYEGFFVIQDSV